ncbi:MAG: acylphosphatase [Chloroflexi bacterium]|nr:acylphosphatase [Chloroflexota bacterium]
MVSPSNLERGKTARLHAIVRGKVQGVYFRDAAVHEATAQHLKGWVRNLADGRSVEVVAEGPRPVLEALLTWLHQGPPQAHVEKVEVEWGRAAGGLAGFRITA